MIIVTTVVVTVVKFSEPIARQPDSESDCSTALWLAAPFNYQSVSESTHAAGWSIVSLIPGLTFKLASLGPGPDGYPSRCLSGSVRYSGGPGGAEARAGMVINL